MRRSLSQQRGPTRRRVHSTSDAAGYSSQTARASTRAGRCGCRRFATDYRPRSARTTGPRRRHSSPRRSAYGRVDFGRSRRGAPRKRQGSGRRPEGDDRFQQLTSNRKPCRALSSASRAALLGSIGRKVSIARFAAVTSSGAPRVAMTVNSSTSPSPRRVRQKRISPPAVCGSCGARSRLLPRQRAGLGRAAQGGGAPLAAGGPGRVATGSGPSAIRAVRGYGLENYPAAVVTHCTN